MESALAWRNERLNSVFLALDSWDPGSCSWCHLFSFMLWSWKVLALASGRVRIKLQSWFLKAVAFTLLCSCVKEECGAIKFWLEPGWRGNWGKFSPPRVGCHLWGMGRWERALVNASFTGHRLTQTRASKWPRQHDIAPTTSILLPFLSPSELLCLIVTLISLV